MGIYEKQFNCSTGNLSTSKWLEKQIWDLPSRLESNPVVSAETGRTVSRSPSALGFVTSSLVMQLSVLTFKPSAILAYAIAWLCKLEETEFALVWICRVKKIRTKLGDFCTHDIIWVERTCEIVSAGLISSSGLAVISMSA